MKPFLSIVVPVYNVEKYIKQCIDSILSQTFTDFEVLLIDDGSPDLCCHICDEYAGCDARIRVLHLENRGIVNARKVGVNESRGEYVGFVDSDDWIAPDMYEKLCGFAKSENADIVLCGFINSFEDKEVISIQPHESGFYNKERLIKEIYPKMLYTGKFFNFGLYPAAWNKIYKADIIKNNIKNVDNFIRMGEDAAFTYACLLDSSKVYIIDEPLYYYRRTDSSMSTSYDPAFFDRILKLYSCLKGVREQKKSFDIKKQTEYYTAYLLTLAAYNERNDKSKNFIERCKILKKICRSEMANEVLGAISLKNIPFKHKIDLLLLKRKHYVIICLLMLFKSKIVRSK